MCWRDEVARRLRTHLEIGPGTRIAVVARKKRDIETLCKVLPGAVGFTLAEARAVADGSPEATFLLPARRESTVGHASRVSVPADKAVNGGGFSEENLLAERALDVVVAWLVMTRLSTASRRRLLGEIRRALRVGGILCVVDHNQPRTWWQWLGNVGWCLMRGVEPCARPAHPVAQEVKDAGFERISLRIAFRERIQIVRGKRPPLASEIGATQDIGKGAFAR